MTTNHTSKYLQAGILASLLLIANLLFLIWMTQPRQTAAVQAAAPVAPPVPVPQYQTPVPNAQAEEVLEAQPPAPAAIPAAVPVLPAAAPRPRPATPQGRPVTRVETVRYATAVRTPYSSLEVMPADPSVEIAPRDQKLLVPAGTIVGVRLAHKLSTSHMVSGQTFQAYLDSPIHVDGQLVADRGAEVEGRIAGAEQGGRVSGSAPVFELQLIRLTLTNGERVPVQTSTLERQGKAKRRFWMGLLAVGGAVAGAYAGGNARSAAIGAGAGAGAGAAFTMRKGKLEIPVETRLEFVLAGPVPVSVRR